MFLLSVIKVRFNMQGKLIILFGIDGSGKSTVLEMLKNSKINNTVYTSCLKNTVFEEELYQAEHKLHFSRKDVFSREFKHMLHIGSVIYNVYNNILPILNSGKNVVLDRYAICIKVFTDVFLKSSYGCLSNALDCLPIPTLGIYFDVDIYTATKRIHERNIEKNMQLHYSESKEALAMKQKAYENMIPNEPYPILKIDARKSVGEVYSSVYDLINEVCVN